MDHVEVEVYAKRIAQAVNEEPTLSNIEAYMANHSNVTMTRQIAMALLARVKEMRN